MAKLRELNGWDLMGALVELAEPIGNLANDEAVWECFRECTKKGVSIKQKDGFRFLVTTYSKLIPLVLGVEHRKDMMRILSVVEGKPVAEVMAMNGAELLKDFEQAYKETLEPFFIKSARSQKRG